MALEAGGLSPARAARRAAWLLAALVLAALLVDLGRFHRLEHGDSIVPVLVSLQRWTPFYWDQERYGMLVPLVALPVRDPLWNLLLQRGLLVLSGLGAVALLARHVLPERDWPLAGAVAAAGLVAAAPAGWAFEYLGDQPYGLSLALALLGLAVAEPGPPVPAGAGGPARPGRRSPWRVAAGLLLVLLAHWVNAATGVLLGALAVVRAGEELLAEGVDRGRVRGRLLVDLGLLGAGLLAAQAALRLQPLLTGTPSRLAEGFLPPAEWPAAWATIAGRTWDEAGPWLAGLAAAAAAGAALLSLPSLRPARRPALVRAATLAATALLYAAFAGALRWVAENQLHWRYLIPSVLLLHLAAASLLAEPLARAARLARPAFVAAAITLPVAALVVWGPPSLRGVRADLDRVAGRWTDDLLEARCDLVAGDYWTVWPAVWHAALVARERGLPASPYGLAHRSNPTVPFWWGRPHQALRICRTRGPGSAREAARWLPAYGLWPVEVLERREEIVVLRVRPKETVPQPAGGAGAPATSR